MKTVLAIVAHPDDEVLGIGGTLLKHRDAGNTIHVLILTREPTDKTWQPKLAMADQVRKQLHATYHHLNLPEVALNALPCGEVNATVSKIAGNISPDIIYTHHPYDINQDHQTTAMAAMIAARPHPGKKTPDLYTFETPSSTEWGLTPFTPDTYIALGDTTMTEKLSLFSLYTSEVKPHPHPRSLEMIKAWAARRGSEACLHYAEALKTIRRIR